MMNRFGKVVSLLLLMSALVFADASWVGTTSVDFMNASNWSPVETPAGIMTIENGSPYDPVYSYTAVSYTGISQLMVNSGGKLTVRAGELRPGSSAYINGDIYLEGGSINVRSSVYLGTGGNTGSITITGGYFTCKYVLTLGYNSGSVGILNIWGGTMNMGSYAPRISYSGGTGRISIRNNGVAYCSGDSVNYFQDLVDQGVITTDSGWQVSVVYDGANTVLTTSQVPFAAGPSPANGSSSGDPYSVLLNWTPGKDALKTELYLGTSSLAVTAAQRLTGDIDSSGATDMLDLAILADSWFSGGDADPCPDIDYSGLVDLGDVSLLGQNWVVDADPTYIGAAEDSGITCENLLPGTTYYWRADTVTCDTVTPGEVWNFTTSIPDYDPPAFPGAQGFGAYANGGRGGDVYTVTNLNSSGAGSLRYGIETAPSSGRTIVFAVSGYIPINYNSDTGNQTLRIVQNNVTIAGQTAPGDGIGLKDGRILMTGNNSVIRHLRVRHGKYGGAGDCMNLDSSAHDSIIDHISLMFSTDENISFFNSSLDNFSMQYCTSSWGMERHNAGGLWDLVHGSCHHSLWAHHRTRNPKARPYGLLEWVNNVTCHWRSEGFIMGDSESNVDWYANVVGCYFLSVPDYEFGLKYDALTKGRIASDGKPNFHLFLDNCLHDSDGDGILNGTDKGYDIVAGEPYPLAGTTSGTLSYDQASAAFVGAPIAVTVDDPLTAYKKVLSSAGALRLDASASSLRDELDTLLIDSIIEQQSILVAKDSPRTPTDDHPEYAYDPPSNGEAQLAAEPYNITNSGFGTLNYSTAPVDTDGDGMPDYWENALGTNPSVQEHNNLFANDGHIITASTFFPTDTPAGYTYLEEYLHFCAVPHASVQNSSNLLVDLNKYVLGFSNTPLFTISNIHGGTIYQLNADASEESLTGPMIMFIPDADFAGRAGFSFNVTDAEGSTWIQQFAILVYD